MQEEFTSYTPDMQREVDDFVSALEIECNSIKPVNESTPEEVRRTQESGEGLKPPPILSDAAIVREIEASHGKVPVRAFIPNDDINGENYRKHQLDVLIRIRGQVIWIRRPCVVQCFRAKAHDAQNDY